MPPVITNQRVGTYRRGSQAREFVDLNCSHLRPEPVPPGLRWRAPMPRPPRLSVQISTIASVSDLETDISGPPPSCNISPPQERAQPMTTALK